MTATGDVFDLSNRKALITGATRGIGLAVAEALARRGAAVAITGRKLANLEPAVASLRASGANVLPLVCNQGAAGEIAALFEQLDRHGFTADILVVNAATNPVMSPLLETDPAAWQKILDVNLTGALLTAQQACRRMLSLKRGSVIFVSSVAGIDPVPGLGAYSVSKAGLLGMMRVLARELGPAGIRVNAIAPGLVETRFSAALFQDRASYERLTANVALGRHGQPADVAGTAVFLASDAAAFVTGQVLVVDGGGRL
jgi:NAD(P)-dependent dehydrogenase (short-subunit alcohol dehydrogenase family)